MLKLSALRVSLSSMMLRCVWHDDEVHIKGRGHSTGPLHPQLHMQIAFVMTFYHWQDI
jgi:hypothetical protein